EEGHSSAPYLRESITLRDGFTGPSIFPRYPAVSRQFRRLSHSGAAADHDGFTFVYGTGRPPTPQLPRRLPWETSPESGRFRVGPWPPGPGGRPGNGRNV